MPSSIARLAELRPAGSPILFLLAGCAAYAALVLCTASTPEALALARHFLPHRPPLLATPAAFGQVRGLLIGWAALLGLLGVAAAYATPGGALRAGHRLRESWLALPAAQRREALAGLGLLTALRVAVSLVGLNVDDMASYMSFVRKSLLTVTAYYPVPNNHLLSNTLSWVFYQAYPGYWWSMRVPGLLLSTAGTAGWFLGLLRRTNFRVAAISIVLFSFLETSLFAAGLGRGYTLVMCCSGLGFFSLLLLSDPTPAGPAPAQRAGAGVSLVAAGVLGLFAVPTFAYFLVGAYSWLGLRWRRQPAHLAGLGLLGVATVLGAATLYSPLLLVSGPTALFGNEYVTPLALRTFLHQLPAYSWQLEGGFMGESANGLLASWHVGSGAVVLVLAGFLGLAGAAWRGHLAAPRAAYVLRTGLPALWLWLLPYALLLAQRVQPPGRTLGFKAVFLFLLLSLVADWLLATAGRWAPHLRRTLMAGVGLWIAVQVGQLYWSNKLRLSYHNTPHRAAQWLLTQPPGPILVVGSPWYGPYLPFYFLFENPTATVVVDTSPRARVSYRYLIGSPAAVAAPGLGGKQRLRLPPDRNCEAIEVVARW